MTYTTAQLRDAVLEELGVLTPGESARAEDAATVEPALARLHARLSGRGLTVQRVSVEGVTVATGWTLAAVPDFAADSYTLICAATLAGRYGLPFDRRQELLVLAVAAENELRAQTSARWDGWPTPVDGEPIEYLDGYDQVL